MTRTGIYGGTFNPIHLGHIQLSRALMQMQLVDELWLMVSPQNPFKVSQQLLADDIRLRLAQLAVEDEAGITVSDYEFHLPKPSYMSNTLQHLRHDYPQREFILIVGADNWEQFDRWHQPDEILAHHNLIIYPRPGHTIQNVPDNVKVADTPLLDISSTQIRQCISQPSYNGEGLSPKVWNEIKQNKYYR